MAKQLGHRSPLGLFRPLGLSRVGQRRFLGAPSLSFLDLKTFYPSGFPAVVSGQVSSDSSQLASSQLANSQLSNSQTDNKQADNGQADHKQTDNRQADHKQTDDSDEATAQFRFSSSNIAAGAESQPLTTDSVSQDSDPVQLSSQSSLDNLADIANSDPAALVDINVESVEGVEGDGCDLNTLASPSTNASPPIQPRSFRANLQSYFMGHSQPPAASFHSNPEITVPEIPLAERSRSQNSLPTSPSTPFRGRLRPEVPENRPSNPAETVQGQVSNETEHFPLVQRQALQSDNSKPLVQREPSQLGNNQVPHTSLVNESNTDELNTDTVPPVLNPGTDAQAISPIQRQDQKSITHQRSDTRAVGHPQGPRHDQAVSPTAPVSSFTNAELSPSSVTENITPQASRSLVRDTEQSDPIQRQKNITQSSDSESQLQTRVEQSVLIQRQTDIAESSDSG